jgi:phosphoglycolate phosphatase
MKLDKSEEIVLSFDLDNTLIDNRKGIVNSFNYALKRYNLPPVSRIKIEKMIGIPLNTMFSIVPNSNVNELSASFREYYSTKGIYEAKLITGVIQKLKEFKQKQFRMGIITSKKQEMAEKIIEILRIDSFFEYIIGETEDRKKLGKLDPEIKITLNKMYPKAKIVIIGDHPKDVMLSNNLACPFIGVLTGNHTAMDLKEIKKGKTLIIDSISNLTHKMILSLI